MSGMTQFILIREMTKHHYPTQKCKRWAGIKSPILIVKENDITISMTTFGLLIYYQNEEKKCLLLLLVLYIH